MKINIYSIQKKTHDEYSLLVAEFLKMSKKFATVIDHQLFPSTVAKASLEGELQAKKSYTKLYEPYMQSGFNIAMDVLGKSVDSLKFANYLEDKSEVNFFIGGAFGFEKEFLEKCDVIISLSSLTMTHKLAHMVLCEQIFRGLAINNNHPYHK